MEQFPLLPCSYHYSGSFAVYRNHKVKDLAHSRAGNDNLETTQNAVASVLSQKSV